MNDSNSQSPRNPVQPQIYHDFINQNINSENIHQTSCSEENSNFIDDEELAQQFDAILNEKSKINNPIENHHRYNDCRSNFDQKLNRNPTHHKPTTSQPEIFHVQHNSEMDKKKSNLKKSLTKKENIHPAYRYQIGDGLKQFSFNESNNTMKSIASVPQPAESNHRKLNLSHHLQNNQCQKKSTTSQHCQIASKTNNSERFTNSPQIPDSTNEIDNIQKLSENEIKILRSTQEIINKLINSEIEKNDSAKQLQNFKRTRKFNSYQQNRMQVIKNIEMEIQKLKEYDAMDYLDSVVFEK